MKIQVYNVNNRFEYSHDSAFLYVYSILIIIYKRKRRVWTGTDNFTVRRVCKIRSKHKVPFSFSRTNTNLCKKILRWFPHNIRAIITKIKLPEKPRGMLLFWIQLIRTYRDLSSHADSERENRTWSCPYFT